MSGELPRMQGDDPSARPMEFSYSAKYFEEGMIGWHAQSYRAISAAYLEVVTETANRVLDFGCGDGFYGRLLASKAEHLDGADVSSAGLDRSNVEYYQQVFEADLGGRWTPPALRYDVLFSSEVVEHVENYQQFLANAYAALKPGGILFLTTTTYSCAFFILLTTKPRQITPATMLEFVRGWLGNMECRSRFVRRIWDWTKGHHHGFSKAQLREALQAAGFSITRLDYLHVQPVIYPEFFNNPFQRVRYRQLILVVLPAVRVVVTLVNHVCRRFDVYAPNVVLVARRRQEPARMEPRF